jgi:hypothetical protein
MHMDFAVVGRAAPMLGRRADAYVLLSLSLSLSLGGRMRQFQRAPRAGPRRNVAPSLARQGPRGTRRSSQVGP